MSTPFGFNIVSKKLIVVPDLNVFSLISSRMYVQFHINMNFTNTETNRLLREMDNPKKDYATRIFTSRDAFLISNMDIGVEKMALSINSILVLNPPVSGIWVLSPIA